MKNAIFENDIISLPTLFKKLAVVECDGEKYLKGELDIADSTGRLWDTYKIEIRGSAGYPYSFPKLYETGDAFPKIADWHVYENDNSCCVDVPHNEKILCAQGMDLRDYIPRMAIPYFANQSFRKREGYYLYGEYSHGFLGRLEFYQSKLKAKNPGELISMLEFVIRGDSLDRTASCPFCHNIKFRKCHRTVFKELNLIKDFVLQDWVVLRPFFIKHPNYKLPVT